MKPFLMLAFYFSPEQYESEKKKKGKKKLLKRHKWHPSKWHQIVQLTIEHIAFAVLFCFKGANVVFLVSKAHQLTGNFNFGSGISYIV